MKKALLILCILLSAGVASAQENAASDTMKKWNGIWDPTDPLCPCHDAQKAAEAEYKKMLEEEKKKEETGNNKNSSSGISPVQQAQQDNNNSNNNTANAVNTSQSSGNSPDQSVSSNNAQVQTNSNDQSNSISQQAQQSTQVSTGSSISGTGGSSNYPPGIKAKTGKMKFRKFMHNTGKTFKKIFPRRNKKKKLLDGCWE